MRFLWIVLYCFTFCLHAGDEELVGVYLTWQQDPARTMVVQWVSKAILTDDVVEYHVQSDSNVTDEPWKRVKGRHKPLPEQTEPYLVHTVVLTNLEPATRYAFRLSSCEDREYHFKTMPQELSQPIRFVVGGDVYHDSIEILEETNKAAAQTNPHFVVLGGDIAYAWNSKKSTPSRYLAWLKSWYKTMVTSEGDLIPLVPAIGNHDVKGGYEKSPKQAGAFYALFATPGLKGHHVLDFGSYMSFFLLDSGHTHPIAEEQTAWLDLSLKRRKEMPHKFAAYHVGAYPSYRPQNLPVSVLIRKWWVPLFEKYGLTAAFEHHDHTYKRTHLIKENQIDPEGVLYLGDGCWGVQRPRDPKSPQQLWYLARSAALRHFILVTITEKDRRYQAITPEGLIFDETVQTLP